jgi:inorganic pyrophosphatase
LSRSFGDSLIPPMPEIARRPAPVNNTAQPLWQLLGVLFKPHPWHGVSPGDRAPEIIQCFIEVVPSDTLKYEIDKISGYLKVDRPQKYSNVCPALYGFVPQTFCGESVGALSSERTGRQLEGDGDPLDICIFTDRPIQHGNILVECIPIGGLRMIDHNEADDKIVAVLKDDATYGLWKDIRDIPSTMLDRLRHYFLTYKQAPDLQTSGCEITHVYGCEEAREVIRRSLSDYQSRFGNLEQMLDAALSVMR